MGLDPEFVRLWMGRGYEVEWGGVLVRKLNADELRALVVYLLIGEKCD